jgi:hypothetical protein
MQCTRARVLFRGKWCGIKRRHLSRGTRRQAIDMPWDVNGQQADTIFRLVTLRRRINPNRAMTKSKWYLMRNWPRMKGGRGR